MVQDCNMVLQPHDNRMTAYEGGDFSKLSLEGCNHTNASGPAMPLVVPYRYFIPLGPLMF